MVNLAPDFLFVPLMILLALLYAACVYWAVPVALAAVLFIPRALRRSR